MSLSRSYVSVDLGAERIAAVEVTNGTIRRWVSMTPVPGSVSGGAPVDPDRLARQLRAALDRAGVNARAARVALPDAAMLTRILDLPAMPRRHLGPAIGFAVERSIPIPSPDLAWAWTWEPTGNGHRPVRIIAGWRDVMDKVRRTMSAAGLRLEVIEPRSAALKSVFGTAPTLLLEHVGETVQATAVAGGLNPFTAQARVPVDEAGWPKTLESLVMAARRHLGPGGRELRLFVSRDLAVFVPQALGARPAAAAVTGLRSPIPADGAADGFLAAIGLTFNQGRLPALRTAGSSSAEVIRARVQDTGSRWVPVLAAATIASWSAVAAGTALLLGWHPSWPLAP